MNSIDKIAVVKTVSICEYDIHDMLDMSLDMSYSTRLVNNKSDIKCINTFGCLDQYIGRGWRPWNSWDREAA